MKRYYLVGWSPTNRQMDFLKYINKFKVISQNLCFRNQQVRSSSLRAGSKDFKGLGCKNPGPFFVIQTPLPVGIVGGPDLL